MNKQEIIKKYMQSLSEEPKEILLERIEAFLYSMSNEDLQIMHDEKFNN